MGKYNGTFRAKSLDDAMQAEQIIRSFLHEVGNGCEYRNKHEHTEIGIEQVECREDEFLDLLRGLIPFLAEGKASRYVLIDSHGWDTDLTKFRYVPERKEWNCKEMVPFFDVTDVLDETEAALLKDLLASCRSEAARTAEAKLFEGPCTYTVGEEKSEET